MDVYHKLNRDKTELLILNASSGLPSLISSISVCGEIIQPSPSAKNIGVEFDSVMSMEKHRHVQHVQICVLPSSQLEKNKNICDARIC